VCESGINIPQMRLSIGQVDDTVALAQQWLEQLHQLADHGHKHETSTELAQADVLLADVRGKLEAAQAALEGGTSASDVTVELV
jgi:hypothetical protein